MSKLGHQLLQMHHLVQCFDGARSYVYVATEVMWEISVPSTQFYYEPKTTLKK